VNGSELRYQLEKKLWQDRSPVFGGEGIQHDRKLRGTERRHREHDELRYSIRSVYKYFQNNFSRIRIISSDFYDANSNSWVGQVPYWLDLNAARLNGLSLLFTSQLYAAKSSLLPVFNSLALESQFYNVEQGPEDPDVMLYLNDDMFLATPHSVSDFWNPVVGLNMQFDPSVVVENQNPSVEEFQKDWNSEWTALRYSNFLLSNISKEVIS
jgi:Stealth protein CR2, conserved region 2